MSFNVTQTISSPSAPRPKVAPSTDLKSENERECLDLCRDRFKYVIALSVVIQYFFLMLYAILLNISFLHPVTWAKESVSILCSPLMFVVVIHGYFKLKPLLEEKVYYPTRFSRFIKGFRHESAIVSLNFFIGLFTSLIFIRYLHDDFKTLTYKAGEKKFLNEKYAFLVLNGAFASCYFYFNQRGFDQTFAFPVIHQSKFLQLRRQFVAVLKSSFVRSLMPAVHFLAFYVIFGGTSSYLLRRVFRLNADDSSIFESFAFVLNLRLLAYSWILTSVIWCNVELMTHVTRIFATEPKEFPIEGASLTLPEALGLTKFQITQQLAAQDLSNLADSPNPARRKQFYTLSNPGGHPHNWKQLVQKSSVIIDQFCGDLKKIVDGMHKNSSNVNNNNYNQPMNQFYENKRVVREFNGIQGIRNLGPAGPLKYEPVVIEKKTDYVSIVKQRLLRNQVLFYFLGESDFIKLDFLISQNSQTIAWMAQGISAIIAKSISEDSYGVVQHDIKQVLKSFIKLKSLLDKVGTISVIAKDRNLIALKSAVRRSIYRITAEFSHYFDDLMLDPEDIRTLQGFVTFKEM